MYEKLVYAHVGFTAITLLSGIVAMVASPKGAKLHRKSGLIYFYAFIGIIVTAILMTCIKYRDLFLGFTIFNSYLLFTGYRVLKRKREGANWQDWSMLIIFLLGGVLLLVGALRIDDNFFVHGYKWSTVRVFIALLTFYLAVNDFRRLKRKSNDAKSWLYNHMEKMLITYISLIGGVFLRVLDQFPTAEGKWLCWIVPYIICMPLIAYWARKYKSNKIKPQLKTGTE